MTDQTNKPLRFIVVDDDHVSNLVSKFIIRKFNPEATIEIFTDPEFALKTIVESIGQSDSQPETIIFLDINMPVMNGWEFLGEFLKSGKVIYQRFTIYMFSSSIDKNDIDRAETHLLVSGFLSKPLNLHQIEATFKEFSNI